jgi:hypothetical protein
VKFTDVSLTVQFYRHFRLIDWNNFLLTFSSTLHLSG